MPRFLWGKYEQGCLYFTVISSDLPAFPPHSREAFPFAHELVNLTQAIAKYPVAHANDW
ncbi:hypothetical protein [Tunturiibacter gelidoferens]|uniref:Uncharacterized protein n=1 Tax=Tunturiibacter lichenicola TaxID=2051959 RepID=A0A7Y9NQA7_9BACT|nr:hypothetical protein [Edaphobacter lichenicola]NYF53598.1 hypothetical protein [Edaphobacter lichenicola]